MDTQNALTLSEKLIELLARKRKIHKEKNTYVKSQKYEEAARVRDQERRVWEDILNLIQTEGKYDFSKSKRVEKDIMTILDLVEDGDTDFSNAVNKLEAKTLERLKIMKDIEKYNLGQITLDELHSGIETSFDSVIRDFKKKVNNL
jgi:hypothetical protein